MTNEAQQSTDIGWVAAAVHIECAYFACNPPMTYEEFVAIDFTQLPVAVDIEEGSFAYFVELWCLFPKGITDTRRYELATQVVETIEAHRRTST